MHFHAEIQDGRQGWQENNFLEKSPVDSADNLKGIKVSSKSLYLTQFLRY